MTGNVGNLLNEREKTIATKNKLFEAFGMSLFVGLAVFILALIVLFFLAMMGKGESYSYVLYSCGFITLLPLFVWAIRAPFTIPPKKKLETQIRKRIKKEIPVGTKISIGLRRDKKELRANGTKTTYSIGLVKVAEYDNYNTITTSEHSSAIGTVSEIKQNCFTFTMNGKKYMVKYLALGEDSIGSGDVYGNGQYYYTYSINTVT